jgi:DNA-binding response OmpR family regulator
MAAPETAPKPAILVVDDEELALRMMERALTEAGYSVHAASNPIAALELATVMPVRPELMVTDLSLQPISGSDLARLVGGSHSGTRILFVCERSEADTAPDGPVLHKPFSAEELVESVRRLLAAPVGLSA